MIFHPAVVQNVGADLAAEGVPLDVADHLFELFIALGLLEGFDLALENGRSNFDVHHRFATTLVWQPGYFHGRGRILRTALDGFTIAPIIAISSGVPYTATVSGKGFKKSVVTQVKVDVGLPATVNVQMEVGGATEQVTIQPRLADFEACLDELTSNIAGAIA